MGNEEDEEVVEKEKAVTWMDVKVCLFLISLVLFGIFLHWLFSMTCERVYSIMVDNQAYSTTLSDSRAVYICHR